MLPPGSRRGPAPPPARAMPTLARTKTVVSSSSKGGSSSMASRWRRGGHWPATRRRLRTPAGTRPHRSGPRCRPIRRGRWAGGHLLEEAVAGRWPRLSLITLKSSRSMEEHGHGRAGDGGTGQPPASIRSSSRERLGSPVSLSCRASCSRVASNSERLRAMAARWVARSSSTCSSADGPAPGQVDREAHRGAPRCRGVEPHGPAGLEAVGHHFTAGRRPAEVGPMSS